MLRIFSTFLFSIVLLVGTITVHSQPLPPQNLTAVLVNATTVPQVKLSWTVSSNTATKFNIYKKLGTLSDTASFLKVASNFNGLSFVDRHVVIGKTYSYYVTAVTSTGQSIPSNKVEIAVVFTPPIKGVISGKVVSDVNQTPISFPKIKFIGANNPSGTVSPTVSAVGDSLGNFKVRLNPGSYYLYTSATGFKGEYFNNSPTIQNAQQLVVAGNDSSAVSVSLAPIIPPVMFTLTGQVTDSLGNGLKAMMRVYTVRLNSHHLPSFVVVSDSLGNYTMNVRQNDTLVIYAKPYNNAYLPEFYLDKRSFIDADRIAVTGNITGINFVLEMKPIFANGISGTVVNDSAVGMEAIISAFPKRRTPSTSPNQFKRYITTSDMLGNYSFSNMVPADYILLAMPSNGYKPTFFKYDGSQTMRWRNADSVPVSSNGVVSGINFTVLPIAGAGAGMISGFIKNTAGLPLQGAFVFVLNQNSEIASFAISDANGRYVITDLLLGTYQIASDKEGYTESNSQTVSVDYTQNSSQSISFVLTTNSPTSVGDNLSGINNYELAQNYPNPFNPSTVISWQLPVSSHVTLKVYDILGNLVASLVNETKESGQHKVEFNGSKFSSGVYFYELRAGDFISTKKLLLMK